MERNPMVLTFDISNQTNVKLKKLKVNKLSFILTKIHKLQSIHVFQRKNTVFLLYFIYCFEQKCKNIEHPSIVNSYEVTFFGNFFFLFYDNSSYNLQTLQLNSENQKMSENKVWWDWLQIQTKSELYYIFITIFLNQTYRLLFSGLKTVMYMFQVQKSIELTSFQKFEIFIRY